MVRHNRQHGPLKMSEDGPARLSAWPAAESKVRHYDQHGQLEGSEDGPAWRSARSVEVHEDGPV